MRLRTHVATAVGVGIIGISACDSESWITSPAQVDELASADAGPGDAGVAPTNVGLDEFLVAQDLGLVLGASCLEDQQCDDGLACTVDSCDQQLQRCAHRGNDARCSDGIYCNGVERCRPRLGCRAGVPESCSDGTSCTVDTCQEQTRECLHAPRDVDGDGDPDGNCSGGADCDDQDPRVSSHAREVCNNNRDDNCDGLIDESDCDAAQFDSCAEALLVAAPQTVLLNPAGTRKQMSSSCFPESGDNAVDLIFQVVIPEGPAQDLSLTAQALGARLALADALGCQQLPTTGDCVRGISLDSGLGVVRLRRQRLRPGTHSFVVFTDFRSEIELAIDWQEAKPLGAPSTCEDPGSLVPGEVTVVPVQVVAVPTLAETVDAGVAIDRDAGATIGGDAGVESIQLSSECGQLGTVGIYEFGLLEPADVRVFARSLDDFGNPRLSLRQGLCSVDSVELSCIEGRLHPLTVRQLPAGNYHLAVSDDGPSDIEVVLDIRPPAEPPPSDSCVQSPPVSVNGSAVVSFSEHIDNIEVGCLPRAIDAAFTLNLEARSDVLVVGRFSSGDFGAVALSSVECLPEQTLTCTAGTNRPVRLAQRGLPAGPLRVIVESQLGLSATVLTAVRPAAATVIVPGADGCNSALTISPGGGAFEGSTLNATSEFSASCDFASAARAPEQLLRFVLSEPKRVLFDARGSSYDVLLNLRKGPSCPGTELDGGCALSSGGVVSFLDMTLGEGEYFLQVDGYAGASGAWKLDAYFLELP